MSLMHCVAPFMQHSTAWPPLKFCHQNSLYEPNHHAGQLSSCRRVHWHQKVQKQPAAASSDAGSFHQEDTPQSVLEISPVAAVTSTGSIKRLRDLAFPLILQNFVGYASGICGLAFVGCLGAGELASYVLANSVYNVVGLSVALGLSSGIDTLAGTAVGGNDYSQLGLILQRALAICWTVCIPVACVWWRSESLLLNLGQEPEVAVRAARLLWLWVPCLLLNATNECLKRILQAQRLAKPMVVVGAVSVLLTPLFFYLCMDPSMANMGLDGSALAATMTQLTSLIGLLGYIVSRNIKKSGPSTWQGWQLGLAFSNWWQYLQYGLPAAIMICLEWWVFEVIVLMAGWVQDGGTSLAATGLCTTLISWLYMLPLGLSSAVNTITANALGAGDGPLAAETFRVGLLSACALQGAIVGCVLVAGPHLVPLLCQDEAVRALTISALPILAVLTVFDGFNAVVSGVLRGAGRQRLGAVVNTLCCCVSLFWAHHFALRAGMGVPGFLGGVSVGASLQLLILLPILLRAKSVVPVPASTNQAPQPPVMEGKAVDSGSSSPVPKAEQPQWWDWDWEMEALRLAAQVKAEGRAAAAAH